MKILLIIPTLQYSTSYPAFLSISDFPVGFAYLASALKAAGHEVLGLNPNNDASFSNQQEMLQAKIQQSFKQNCPDLACLGGLCTDYAFLKDALKLIRECSPSTPVVLGGGIINNDAEFVFQALKPDFCVRGEGEEVLVQLADNLARGDKDYKRIPNLGYSENGVARFTKLDFKYGDIDKRAFPDYEPFGVREMLDDYWLATRYHYRYPRLKPRPWPLVAARSCPFSCTFCVHHRGIKYRARSIENIMEEIGYFYDKYHFNILLLLDELFAVNNERLRDFSNALLKAKEEKGWDFHWTFQTHASAAFNDETLALAKKAGCYWYSYGMESASPTVLASMNKRSKPEQIASAIQSANKLGIGFGGNFIFGDPAENPKTLAESLQFFHEYCTDLHVQFAHIHPYPGSKIFDLCLSKGLIKDKLDYYEHIDEASFNLINMTSNSRYWWNIWILAVNYLGGLFLWVKSATSVSCELVKDEEENPIARHYGMQVYKIGVKCPHCSHLSYSLEMASRGNAKQAFVLGGKMVGIISWISQWRTKNWFARTCLFVAYLASFLIKPFKLLLYMKNREPINLSMIVTGCPRCNKRFRMQVA